MSALPKGLERKTRAARQPTREDLERACPPLFLCPHCRRWGIVAGYVCNACDMNPGDKAMNAAGEIGSPRDL